MKGMSDFKANMYRAQNVDELMVAVEDACHAGRFHYFADASLLDNAQVAKLQSKHAVSELLTLAAKRERLL